MRSRIPATRKGALDEDAVRAPWCVVALVGVGLDLLPRWARSVVVVIAATGVTGAIVEAVTGTEVDGGAPVVAVWRSVMLVR
jgi:hypothetical protein